MECVVNKPLKYRAFIGCLQVGAVDSIGLHPCENNHVMKKQWNSTIRYSTYVSEIF